MLETKLQGGGGMRSRGEVGRRKWGKNVEKTESREIDRKKV